MIQRYWSSSNNKLVESSNHSSGAIPVRSTSHPTIPILPHLDSFPRFAFATCPPKETRRNLMVPDRLTNSLVTFFVFDASIWTSLVNVDSAYLLKCTMGRNPENKALGHPRLSGMVCLSIVHVSRFQHGRTKGKRLHGCHAILGLLAQKNWVRTHRTCLGYAGTFGGYNSSCSTKALECLRIKTCRITPKETLGPVCIF